MYGANLEAGYHITKFKDIDIETAAGPYYFYNQSKNAVGGKVRVSARLYDMVKLTASGSYDPVFKGIGQGEMSFIVPFGPKGKVKGGNCKKQILLRDRAVQHVERSEIIVADTKRYHSVAKDPDTDAPYEFIFVNNLSSSLGTIESPYPTIQKALAAVTPGSIIYVYQGSGAAYNTGASGITLQDGQSLWGASTKQSLATTLGDISIAAQSAGMPTFTGADNTHAVITLGNNNEISGLHITGVNSGYGIAGGDVDNLTYIIFNPVIANNWIDGTYINEASTIVVSKGETYIKGNRANKGLYALAIGSDQLNAYIGDNEVITAGNGAAFVYGVSVTSNGNSSVQADIYSNNISLSQSGTGLLLGVQVGSADQSTMVVNMSSNDVSIISAGNQISYGLRAFSDNQSSLRVTASQNQVYVEARGAGPAFGMELLSRSNSLQTIDISSNSINAKNLGTNQAYAIISTSAENSSLQGNIYSNRLNAESSATNVQSWGVLNRSLDASSSNIDVFSNYITSIAKQSASYGVDILSSSATSFVSSNVYQNTILTQGSKGQGCGIRAFTVTGASPSMTANIFNNSLDVTANLAAQGVGVQAREDTGSLTANIQNNTGVVKGSSTDKTDISIQGGVSGVFEPNSIQVQ